MKNTAKLSNLITILVLTIAFTFGGMIAVMADDEVQEAPAQDTIEAVETAEIEEPAVEATDEEIADAAAEAPAEDAELADETAEEATDTDVETADEITDETVETVDTVDTEDASEDTEIAEEEVTVVIEPPAVPEEEEEIGEAVYEEPNEEEETVVVIEAPEIPEEEEIGEALYEPPVPAAIVYTIEGGMMMYAADENGVVEIEGFLHKFDKDAYGTEDFEVMVDGASYYFTIDSEGNVFGDLPVGFSIKDGILRIEGASEDSEIIIFRQGIMSSMAWEPAEYEPVVSTNPPSYNSGYRGYSQANAAGAYYAADEEVAAEEAEEAEETLEEAAEEFFFPEADDEESVLGVYSDDTKGFPGAAVAITLAGLLAAIGALWKVGILSF